MFPIFLPSPSLFAEIYSVFSIKKYTHYFPLYYIEPLQYNNQLLSLWTDNILYNEPGSDLIWWRATFKMERCELKYTIVNNEGTNGAVFFYWLCSEHIHVGVRERLAVRPEELVLSQLSSVFTCVSL